jgi:prepilin-type N-terminal cleavage/methylation domain-containing protein
MSHGFTLLEVLVVLAIVGLVSGITLTMVTQLRQNLERFFPAAEYYPRLEVRIGMLSKLIGGLVPSHTPDSEFRGEPNGFYGLGTYYPVDPWPSEQRTRVSVLTADRISIVTAERLAMDGSVLQTFEVMRLPCERSRFYYLNLELHWLDQWRQQRQFPYLPLAVQFHCADETIPFTVVAAVEREGVTIVNDVNMLSGFRK